MSLVQSPHSVIVAEHYPIACASLADLLRLDGYRAFQAEDVKAAWSCINTVDDLGVLLMDLDMFGWRSIIRHAARETNALVIAMEGNEPFSKIYDLKERGVGACLQKPIVYNDLRGAIRENVGRGNATDLIRSR